MVVCYWGKNFSVNRVWDIVNVDCNGVLLWGLFAVVESIGYFIRLVKVSFD